MIDWTHTLPVVFLVLMGVAMLAYVVLDGYDLGVGMLMRHADPAQQDMMVASIGPFWDANETWLVLGVGVLLIAFPKAHGMVLGALYLPVALMLVGLCCAAWPSSSAPRMRRASGCGARCSWAARSWRRPPRAGCWAAMSLAWPRAGAPRCLPPPSQWPCRRPMCCWAPAGWC